MIGASATESGSNAAGFTGQNWSWAISVTATFSLDFVRPAQISTRGSLADAADIRSERALQQIETSIFEAWQRVEASRARVESANVGLEASRRAAEDARIRYESGAGTQLEQIQAERDLFQAEATRIQQVADLRVARAVLWIRSGMDL